MKTISLFARTIKMAVGLVLLAPFCLFADGENYDYDDVSGEDFSLKSLQNSSWMYVYAENTNFRGANLTNANFGFAATIYQADFTGATISGAIFHAANGFSYDQLRSTWSYQHQDLRGVNISEFNMNGWDLSNQNLSGSQWLGGQTWMVNTNLRSANLSGAYFYEADAYNSDFKNANLSGAHFQYMSGFYNLDFKNANLSNVHIEYTPNMGNLNFTNANLRGATISGSSDNGYINFSGADLRGVDFSEWEITEDVDWIIKNTITENGKVNNFSMTTAEDVLNIRSGDAMVGIEGDGDYTVEGGAKMIFHEGENSTLLVSTGQTIVFSDSAMIEYILNDMAATDVVLVVSDTGAISYGQIFDKSNLVILNSDGTLFEGEYTLATRSGMLGFTIVPEPAAMALIFGALAMGVVAYRRRT